MIGGRKNRRKFNKTVIKYGKVFRTKAGKLGRYVYENGKRVAFERVTRRYRR